MTPYFTKRFETQYGYLDFYFNRIYTVEGIRYHISFVDRNKKIFVFYMVEMAGQWVLPHHMNVPVWLKPLHGNFEKAIKESLGM